MAASALIAVPNAITVLGRVGQTDSCCYNNADSLAWAVMFALVFLYVEWERRKVQPVGRAATLMRQIHENVLQGLLLIIASPFVFYALTETVQYVLVQSGALLVDCNSPSRFNLCETPVVLGPALAALFAIASWGLYVWLGLWDQQSVLRWIVRFVMYAYGVGWLLVGLVVLVQTLVESALGVPDTWQSAQRDGLPFVGELVTGALIAVPYFFWIRRVSSGLPKVAQSSQQGLLAVPAGLSAGPFLAGLAQLLSGLLEQLLPGGSPLSREGWAMGWALLVAGLGYLPLWLGLRRASDPALGGPVVPRRVYVLVLLAGTAIAAVGLVVTALYQFLAEALGIGSGDTLLARQALVAALVTGVTALYHLWRLRADLRGLHARQAAALPALPAVAEEVQAPEVPVAPSPNGAETLESILNQVATGTLEPAAAASRIRALPKL